jgi:hypothetical protein
MFTLHFENSAVTKTYCALILLVDGFVYAYRQTCHCQSKVIEPLFFWQWIGLRLSSSIELSTKTYCTLIVLVDGFVDGYWQTYNYRSKVIEPLFL